MMFAPAPQRTPPADLVPLWHAAAVIHGQLSPTEATPGVDRVAAAIASLVPLYRRGPAALRARALQEEELEGGRVVDGGRAIEFGDGRSPIGHLYVRAAEVVLARRAILEERDASTRAASAARAIHRVGEIALRAVRLLGSPRPAARGGA